MSSKLWWVHSPFFSRWSSPVHLFTSFTQFLIFSYSNCHVMQSWSWCPSPPIADHIIKVKRGRLPSEGKTISGKLHQGVKSVCCLSAREADLQYKSIRGRVMDNGASINSPFIRNNTLHLIKRCWRTVDLKYVPCCEVSLLWNQAFKRKPKIIQWSWRGRSASGEFFCLHPSLSIRIRSLSSPMSPLRPCNSIYNPAWCSTALDTKDM